MGDAHTGGRRGDTRAWPRVAGPSPRSLGTPAGTARRSASTWPPGGEQRERAASCLEPCRGYIEARFDDDPHRRRDACCIASSSRPGSIARTRRWCGSCAGWSCGRCAWSASTGRGPALTVEIEHPAGEEIQWDWLELARDAVGRAGVRAGRRAVALGPVPGGVLRADDVRAPRRARSTRSSSRWAAPRGCGGLTGWRRS